MTVESTAVSLDPFTQLGTPSELIRLFGDKDKYFSAVKELEMQLYLFT